MKKFCFSLFFVAFLLSFASVNAADIGVGVGTGKINVDEKLNPGAAYNLPPMTVFNTGTVAATYKVEVAFNETQPQKKPKAEWFSFSPESFSLEPDQSQTVIPRISLPLNTPPGDYFVYLQAVPDQTAKKGTTSISVAAATKLYFSTVPANFLMAIFYRLISIYQQFAPLSYLLTGVVISITLILVFRKLLIKLLLMIVKLLEKV